MKLVFDTLTEDCLPKPAIKKLTVKARNYPLSKEIVSLTILPEVRKILSMETCDTLPKEVHPEKKYLGDFCPCGSTWENYDIKLTEGFLYFT